jgi:DNA (cytosine-5)-methyltransferase 1
MTNSSNNIFLSDGKNADRQKHRFPYKWTLKDAVFTKDKGTVFSCFACGGGSTMGYKLAGFDVLGCNEIDPKMIEAYKANHNPKYAYLEPIQTFKLRKDLPKELYNLDILDGSPPCSSFSMAGNREKDWGKEKKFREGQAEQVLDNLFFDFIDLAKELHPKVVVAENVSGLMMGEARQYVRKIYSAFQDAGYQLRIEPYLLDASKMGVPQRRKRVFFVALRNDLAKPFMEQVDMFQVAPKLELNFNEPEIKFGSYRDFVGSEKGVSEERKRLLNLCVESDKCISDINERESGKVSGFNALIIKDNEVCPTITSGEKNYRFYDKLSMTDNDYKLTGSYAFDYNFNGNDVKYLVGMSVPPVMTAQIATEIYNQWLCKSQRGKEEKNIITV